MAFVKVKDEVKAHHTPATGTAGEKEGDSPKSIKRKW